jgi:hypothetical protein
MMVKKQSRRVRHTDLRHRIANQHARITNPILHAASLRASGRWQSAGNTPPRRSVRYGTRHCDAGIRIRYPTHPRVGRVVTGGLTSPARHGSAIQRAYRNDAHCAVAPPGRAANGIEVLWNPVKRRVKTWEGEAGMVKRREKGEIGIFSLRLPVDISSVTGRCQGCWSHAKAQRRKVRTKCSLSQHFILAPLREVKSWNRKTLESGQSGMLSDWLPVSLTPFRHPSFALPAPPPPTKPMPLGGSLRARVGQRGGWRFSWVGFGTRVATLTRVAAAAMVVRIPLNWRITSGSGGWNVRHDDRNLQMDDHFLFPRSRCVRKEIISKLATEIVKV